MTISNPLLIALGALGIPTSNAWPSSYTKTTCSSFFGSQTCGDTSSSSNSAILSSVECFFPPAGWIFGTAGRSCDWVCGVADADRSCSATATAAVVTAAQFASVNGWLNSQTPARGVDCDEYLGEQDGFPSLPGVWKSDDFSLAYGQTFCLANKNAGNFSCSATSADAGVLPPLDASSNSLQRLCCCGQSSDCPIPSAAPTQEPTATLGPSAAPTQDPTRWVLFHLPLHSMRILLTI